MTNSFLMVFVKKKKVKNIYIHVNKNELVVKKIPIIINLFYDTTKRFILDVLRISKNIRKNSLSLQKNKGINRIRLLFDCFTTMVINVFLWEISFSKHNQHRKNCLRNRINDQNLNP